MPSAQIRCADETPENSCPLAVALATLPLSLVVRAEGVPDGQRWWSHVLALADDKLEGRNTGSEGHRKAAEYVAREFERAGLKPAGTDGFLQPVRLISREIDEAHSSLTLDPRGRPSPLALGQDAIISSRVDPAPTVEAELVFAGYGLPIPEAHHDDFAGLDVRGKLVVFLSGAPASIPGPLAAHMQSGAERAASWKRLGAIGMVSIANPKNMDIPWERSSLARFMPSMSLADPAMDETRGLKLAVTINPAHADKLLAGSGHTFREILDAADAGQAPAALRDPRHDQGDGRREAGRRGLAERRGHAAGGRPEAQGRVRRLLGAPRSPGRSASRSSGDAIYNGAMDNASGHRRDARRRGDAEGVGHEAAPIGAVRRGDGRGEGPARLAVLRPFADGRPRRRSSPTSTPTCSCRSSR